MILALAANVGTRAGAGSVFRPHIKQSWLQCAKCTKRSDRGRRRCRRVFTLAKGVPTFGPTVGPTCKRYH